MQKNESQKLRECPFCGGKALLEEFPVRKGFESCIVCSDRLVSMPTITYDTQEEATEAVIEDWNRRTTIATNIYDKEETYPNCTVQVLTNTATGETSVGWWMNGGEKE